MGSHGRSRALAGGERRAFRAAYADAERTPFWLDSPQRPAARPALEGAAEADLAIVGGGLSGLWAARAGEGARPGPRGDPARAGPDRRTRPAAATAASARRFSPTASPTAWPASPRRCRRLSASGLRTSPRSATTIEPPLGIDCAFETGGDLDIAIEAARARLARRGGRSAARRSATRSSCSTATASAASSTRRCPSAGSGDAAAPGSSTRRGCAGAWPARPSGSASRICEHTAVERARAPRTAGSRCGPPSGDVAARQALLATSAFPGLVGAIRRRVVPVWDYVLVTEPLHPDAARGDRLAQPPGDRRHGEPLPLLPARPPTTASSGAATTRSTTSPAPSTRRANSARRASTCSPGTSSPLFPQLEGIRFSHRWGGAIDTCSRFFAFHGTALGGRVAYTRRPHGPRRRRKPLRRRGRARPARRTLDRGDPAAGDPLEAGAVPTRAAALGSDRAHPQPPRGRRPQGGRRGLWLRTLDRLGLGFDS